MNSKRIILGIVLGAIFGIICATGAFILLSSEPSIPNLTMYLAGAFYNRIIMGFLIGLASEIKIVKDKNNIINSIIRGAILGILVSTGFAFFNVYLNINFFIMGIVFGVLNDLISTKISKPD